MTVEVIPPFPVFTNVDGEPLEDGFVYIGAVNQNPQVVPISIYWDFAGTIPAAQPIRTLGGYASRNGTPSRVYVAQLEYSIVVLDSNSTLVYSDMNNQAGSASLWKELADPEGAGLVGFDADGVYPPGTVGYQLAAGQFNQILIGDGVKGNPQTNVGAQIHRDITETTPSYHGFNVCDYFAADTNAINPIGTDLQIGDGTQDALFVLGHVNDFQCTDITDLGLGRNPQHFIFISQPVQKSGTISRTRHFAAIDQLGVRDTPGFGVAGFEDNGPAVCNNQTGLSTVIRHGTNPKSLHIQAGSTDAGATLTSGGAVSDFETQIINRQATASTSKATGALLLTAGGIGCFGSIFAGIEVAAVDDNAQVTVRSAANVLRGRMTHDGTTMRVRSESGALLRFGVSATDLFELLPTNFRPVTDNLVAFGDGSHRVTQLFAVTATVSTSDANTKTDVLPIDDKLLDAWADVAPVVFRFKDAIAEKGDAARIHAGYIAQQVRDTLAAHGIDGFRYALLCEDELTEEVTEFRTVKVPRMERVPVDVEKFETVNGVLIRTVDTVEEERPVTEQKLVFNADGTPYLVERIDYREEAVPVEGGEPVKRVIGVPVMAPLEQTVQVFDEVQEPYTVTVKTGEKRMGLRYEHCLVIECAYLRRELSRLAGEKVKK